MSNIYVGSVSYAAVTAWSTLQVGDSTANGGRGTYIRATAPAVGSERVFRCTTSGIGAVGEPTWTTTKNGTTTDGTNVWTECTGQEADQVSGTWKAPHARLANAVAATWGAAGDTFFVASNHAETQAAAMTITCPGTLASPCNILCVTAAGTVPPVSADLSTTGTVTTTGANAITVNGHLYARGITFNVGTGATAVGLLLAQLANNRQLYDLCNLKILNTGAASGGATISAGINGGDNFVEFKGCGFLFSAVTQAVVPRSFLRISGGSALAGGTNPTAFLLLIAARVGDVVVEGFDFSNWGTAVSLVTGGAVGILDVVFRNCKMAASWAGSLFSTALTVYPAEAAMYNCDSADTNYRLWAENINGSTKNETTLVKTGGASDGDTPLSWKMATSANAEYPLHILRSPEIASKFITAVGVNTTITIDVAHGLPANLNDDEIWLEVQYLGQLGSPATKLPSTFVSDAKANVLAAAAVQSASAATWADGSPPSERKQALSVTFVPQAKGVALCTVCLAKPSVTVYVDPLAQVS